MRFEEFENNDFLNEAKEGKITPPPFVWDKIEATLKEKKKRRVFVWWLYPGLFLLLCIGVYALVLINYDGTIESKHYKERIAQNSIVNNKDSQFNLIEDEFGHKQETYVSSKNESEKLTIKKTEKNTMADSESKKEIKSQPKPKSSRNVTGENNSSLNNYNHAHISEMVDSFSSTAIKNDLTSYSSIILDSVATKVISVSELKDTTNPFEPTILKNEKLKWLSLSLGAGFAGGNFTAFNDEKINLLGKSIFFNGGISYHFNKNAFKAELNYLMVRSNIKLNSPTLPAFELQSDPSSIITPPSPPEDTAKGYSIKINEVLVNFAYERNILTLNKWKVNASLGVGLNALSHIQFKETPSVQKTYWLKSSHFTIGGAVHYQVGDKTTLYVSPQLRKDVLRLSEKSFIKDRFYGLFGFGLTYRF